MPKGAAIGSCGSTCDVKCVLVWSYSFPSVYPRVNGAAGLPCMPACQHGHRLQSRGATSKLESLVFGVTSRNQATIGALPFDPMAQIA